MVIISNMDGHIHNIYDIYNNIIYDIYHLNLTMSCQQMEKSAFY